MAKASIFKRQTSLTNLLEKLKRQDKWDNRMIYIETDNQVFILMTIIINKIRDRIEKTIIKLIIDLMRWRSIIKHLMSQLLIMQSRMKIYLSSLTSHGVILKTVYIVFNLDESRISQWCDKSTRRIANNNWRILKMTNLLWWNELVLDHLSMLLMIIDNMGAMIRYQLKIMEPIIKTMVKTNQFSQHIVMKTVTKMLYVPDKAT